MRTRMLGTLGAALLIVGGTAGCGSGSAYQNTPRPPAPINVTVSLTNARVQISPARVGAGPAVLLVANESSRSRDLTLRASGDGGSCLGADRSSGPINPQGNARLPVELVQGECVVGVRGDGLAAARLVVGRERPSAQADLLQP
jgi:hypothetical protein